MCGRFTNRYSWREIKELYDLTTPYLTSNFPPRTNIAPTQQSFVARVAKDGSRELAELKWGLIPSWSKDDQSAVRMINARAETVASLPAFRAAFKSRPCFVVADGFYEWKKLSLKEKQPYFITRKDAKPFAFAGLWEWCRRKDAPAESADVENFTILTTEPHALCARIHSRMPLMLAPGDFAGWLGAPDSRAALLRPYPADEMEMWPGAIAVGHVKNTGAELIEPSGAAIKGAELVHDLA